MRRATWALALAACLAACSAPSLGSHPLASPPSAGATVSGPTPSHRAPTASSTFRSFPPDVTPTAVQGGLPPVFSPGATNPAVTPATISQTICARGWTATVRPPVSYTTALKIRQLAALGIPGPLSAYEEDHRVPLEIGGNPTDPANLWPEPWTGPHGAHAKDVLENRVHADVCSGRTSLAAAQAFFMGDFWNLPVP